MKRALDVLVSAFGLVILSPVLAAVASAIRLSMGSPVLFKQQRAGRNGRPFELRKFRTMTAASNGGHVGAGEEQRITRLGAFLRRTSLDELPGLWNVVKGDMSLVGPRPLFMDYLPLYTAEQARRHDVLPGITGLAQVSGRNAVSWEERLALDAWYAQNQSFWLDLKILARTVAVVVRGGGVTTPDGTLMPRLGEARNSEREPHDGKSA